MGAAEGSDTKAFIPLHILELQVLLALMGEPRHGYDIVKEVEARWEGGKQLFPANLYRRIRSLRDRGLIEEVDPPVRSDTQRSRRYFSATAFGRQVAATQLRRFESILSEARQLGLLPHVRG